MNEARPDNVPYIVFESAMARSERHSRRLIVALVIAIVLIVASNMAWLWAWMQYDYTSEETSTTTTYDYSQDGEGTNIIGSNNEVNDVAETDGNEENNYEEADTD